MINQFIKYLTCLLSGVCIYVFMSLHAFAQEQTGSARMFWTVDIERASRNCTAEVKYVVRSGDGFTISNDLIDLKEVNYTDIPYRPTSVAVSKTAYLASANINGLYEPVGGVVKPTNELVVTCDFPQIKNNLKVSFSTGATTNTTVSGSTFPLFPLDNAAAGCQVDSNSVNPNSLGYALLSDYKSGVSGHTYLSNGAPSSSAAFYLPYQSFETQTNPDNSKSYISTMNLYPGLFWLNTAPGDRLFTTGDICTKIKVEVLLEPN